MCVHVYETHNTCASSTKPLGEDCSRNVFLYTFTILSHEVATIQAYSTNLLKIPHTMLVNHPSIVSVVVVVVLFFYSK